MADLSQYLSPVSPLVIEAELDLLWVPGGYTWDVHDQDLADILARHFSIEREMPSGNYRVGAVRIVIEQLSAAKILQWRG